MGYFNCYEKHHFSNVADKKLFSLVLKIKNLKQNSSDFRIFDEIS